MPTFSTIGFILAMNVRGFSNSSAVGSKTGASGGGLKVSGMSYIIYTI